MSQLQLRSKYKNTRGTVYIWRKKANDVQAGGSALVAWKKICRPKQQGGLGVLNLDIQNKAFLLKNVHKLFNREDTPWVNLIWNSYYASGAVHGQRLVGSFWWRAYLKLLDSYKALARCNLGDGKVFFSGVICGMINACTKNFHI
jgi:hypothetical protein